VIERDLHVPAGVDAVRAVGVVTPEDYHDVVTPMLATAMRERRRLRVLCTVDGAFAGMTPASTWDDVRLGLTTMRYLAGCAVVSDAPRVREMARFSAFFLAGPVQVFDLERRDEALHWLAALPGAVADVWLRAEQGVIVVDIDQPLRRDDIDAIAAEVDGWLAEHSELPGLVLHAHRFPGWENVSSLLHHLRFVAGRQKRVARVALVMDVPGLDIAGRVAGTLLRPEIRHFPVAAKGEAIRWSGSVPAPMT
jgi:hypothetical protein